MREKKSRKSKIGAGTNIKNESKVAFEVRVGTLVAEIATMDAEHLSRLAELLHVEPSVDAKRFAAAVEAGPDPGKKT